MKPHSKTMRPTPPEIFRSAVGSFLGIALVALADQLVLGDRELLFMIGAFGASAVLVYGAPYSPLAQPYNVVVGHIVSAVVGVGVFQIFGEASWVSVALAVSFAIAAMQLTRSTHPPGGATALIAVASSQQIHDLGFMYVVYPVATGALILVGVAFIVNNFMSNRRWPLYWV